MSTPLLATKLYSPPLRSEWVARPSLVERLNAGLGRKLTLISASAGSGKTTLVAAWLAGLRPGAVDVRPAWLSLDAADNDPHRFISYLAAALQTAGAHVGQEALRLLGRADPPPVEPVIASLINDVAATGARLILVLDDYHAISELAVHEAVGLLLDRLPPRMHLVIATRHDPSLPLARMRGRGEMNEIRQEDLRFSAEEAATFLNRSMGLRLAPAEIATLEERTEGWITGLQLAALSMQGRDAAAISRFIGGFSGRYHFILDYLTDEVLQRQPQPVQTFLMQTAILDRLCGPLCDAVLDNPGPAAGVRMLHDVEAANLFTVPLDDERRWYRYHPLFAELLRARLKAVQPHLVPELHRRAAAWYEQQGLSAEAVQHALATANDALAAEVIERAIRQVTTWSRSDTAIVHTWLSALPDAVVRPRPWLRLFLSRTLYIMGQPESAGQALQALEEWLQDHSSAPDAGQILTMALLDRASYAAVLGSVRQAKELIRKVLAGVPEDHPIARLRAPAILGMAHLRAGELSEAQRAFSQASEFALAIGSNYAAVPLLCNLAEVQAAQARLRAAMHTCEQATQLAVVDGVPASIAGFAELQIGRLLYERDDLEAAERHLLGGMELLSAGGIGESFGSGHAILAQIRQARGDGEGAAAAAERAVQSARRANIPHHLGLALAYQARVWLAQGRLDLAVLWAREYRHSGQAEYLRDVEDLTLARVLLAEGRAAEALALLDALLPAAREAGRTRAVIDMQAVRAVALPGIHDALDALQQALAPAEPEGYARLFLDLGEPMRALLRQAAARGIAPGYVSRLLTAFGPSPQAGAQPLLEPLSERELSVLRLLAKGLSNPEIGARLFISLPTVKSHTRNIYGKLGVHSREEAVARAEALGIIG